jgi:hypothetical protein
LHTANLDGYGTRRKLLSGNRFDAVLARAAIPIAGGTAVPGLHCKDPMDQNSTEIVRCPKCGSADIRYSRKRGVLDSVMDVFFSMDAFRCRSCRGRFRKFDQGIEEEDEQTA